MFRLIYISTPKPEIRQADVAGILDSSRKNNSSIGITGLLIQDHRRFMQYLEGEQSKVEETFARISSDPRHFAVIPLKMGFIGRRQFPDWAMASKQVGRGNSLTDTVTKLVHGCDRDVSAELLSFAAARDRAA